MGQPSASYSYLFTNAEAPSNPNKIGLRNKLTKDGSTSHRNLIIVYVKFTESWIESVCIEDPKTMTCRELRHEVIRLYSDGLTARAQ